MRAEDVPETLLNLPCPDFGAPSRADPGPVSERRVAIVSTAGLMQRGDTPFDFGAADYRIIDAESDADLLMTHVSTNFDRTGFLQDTEVVFPLGGLRQLATEGLIGSVARFHYAFMGATDPTALEPAARQLARNLQGEGTNVVLLVPV